MDPLLEEARKDMREMTDHDWFFWGEAAAMSHMHEGEVELSNTRNGLHAEWEANWEGEYEIYADYQRFLSRFLGIYAGGTFTDEEWEVGVEYVLTKHLSIAGNYHSEFDGGAGLLVRC